MSNPNARTEDLGGSGKRELPPDFLVAWQRYDVGRRLGAGGMGEVFEAWDPRLGRHVALKFLYGTDPETLERFTREARSQARVDHPGICKVFEVGSVAGRPYIAMQEIDGVTLDEAARGVTMEQKVRLVREVADAIHAAHRQGLIHRDLKPGNILVERLEDGQPRPYVVDFGLARDQTTPSGYTLSGAIAGTIGYMSPEQVRGRVEEIDRRTDVYNLGIVLYELLTGRAPFDTADRFQVLIALQNEHAPSPRKFQPSIPRDLETIVLKCLEREPARRYDSARAVADDLGRFLDGEPIMARPASVFYRLRKRLAKHRVLAVVLAIAAVLLAAAGAAMLWSRWEADRRTELAHRFGLQVKEMELVTRMANMLPPDRRMPARRLLEPRMKRVRDEMALLGKLARGPGHYALARGSLALGDLEGARKEIELARAAGHNSADVRYTRGEILGRSYQDALAKATQIGERELRQHAIRSAQLRFRDPALAELRGASGASVESPAFLEAQIAMFEERWDDAVAASRRASAATPWVYEAAMLEATILRMRAATEGYRGNLDGAFRMLDQAGAAMAKVLEIGRSDALAHIEECNRLATTLRFLEYQRRVGDADIDGATAPCRQALTIDPRLAGAWLGVARIHLIAAEDRARHGQDPTPNCDAAADAADRALGIAPASAEGFAARGGAALSRGRWLFNRGDNPRAHLELAARALRRATELDRRSAYFHNTLSNALTIRAYYEDRIGRDTTPFLTEAIEHYGQAIELFPEFATAHSNIGSAWVQLADRAFRTGGDGRSTVEKAIRSLTRAVQLMPSSVSAHNNRGNALLSLAEFSVAAGDDPAAHVEASAVDLRKAIELRPDYALPHYNIAFGQRLFALHRVRRGENPAPHLRAARAELDRYDALSPGDPDAMLQRARLDLLEARHALMTGRDPRALFAEAERIARAGLASEPGSDGLRLVLAERYRWEAEWLRRRGGDATAVVARGLEAVRLAARSPEAAALEGALLIAGGEEAKGQATIAAALRANRNLAGDYGHTTAAASRASSAPSRERRP